MSGDAQNQAKQTYQASQALGKQSGTNANALYGQLDPAFTAEATNPQGLNAQTKADMTTTGEQTTDRAVSGAMGQGNLTAARTRNSGGFAPALDESTRDAMRTNSDTGLKIGLADENLKEQQKQEGLQGLSSLYGTNNNDVLSSLGLQNQSTNTLANAGNSGWFQNTIAAINALKPGGSVGGGSPASFSLGNG